MIFKDGVEINGVKPEIALCLIVVDNIYRNFGFELVVTAVTDGTHSAGSLHYVGYAIDTRTRDFSAIQKATIADTIRVSLTSEFDVVEESDHFHIEFQPKH